MSGIQFRVDESIADDIRRQKSPEETELIRKAAKIADMGANTAVKRAKPGTSELDQSLLKWTSIFID